MRSMAGPPLGWQPARTMGLVRSYLARQAHKFGGPGAIQGFGIGYDLDLRCHGMALLLPPWRVPALGRILVPELEPTDEGVGVVAEAASYGQFREPLGVAATNDHVIWL